MKNEFKISVISIVCAICATAVSGAYAASSVRTLGGAGTYNGASAAAGATAARAGSVRLSPTAAGTTKTVSATSHAAATTSGRGASPQRLSLGKYLGAGKAISVSGSTGSGNNSSAKPGASSEELDAVQKDVDGLISSVDKLKTSVEGLAATKQNLLKTPAGGYIEIAEDGTVSLLTDPLKAVLGGMDGADAHEIVIRVDNGYIQWGHEGLNDWNNLIAVSSLVGEKGDAGQSVDMDEVEELISDQVAQAVSQINLTEYVKAVDVYNKTEADEKFVTSDGLNTTLEAYATTEQLDQVRAGADLTNYYNKIATDDLLAGKANIDDIPEIPTNISNFTNDAGYLVSDDLTDLTTTVSQASSDASAAKTAAQTAAQTVETINNTLSTTYLTQTEAANTYISNNTKIDAATIIEADSITDIELQDGSVKTNILADNAVTKEKVATPVTGTDVTTPGSYVMVLGTDGSQVWADVVE